MVSAVKNVLRPFKRAAERAVRGEPVGRTSIARHYLKGHGIEIGALHRPLPVPRGMTVRYVDRMSVEQLRAHYPELATLSLVPLDLVEDGEKLSTLPAASEDFVIANHFLEHCQDPLGTMANVMRVLKPGGIFFAAVPDKRYTFDCDRPLTTLQHLLDDHHNGPAASRFDHYHESVRLISGIDGSAGEAEANKLMQADYSIHFHTWDMPAYMAFLIEAGRQLNFDIELCMLSEIEIIGIVRKAGGPSDADREKSARDMLASCRKKQ